MPVKITMRYHLIPIRMAPIKKSEKKQVLLEWGEIGTLVHHWLECGNGAATVENNIVVSNKIKHGVTHGKVKNIEM